MSILRHLGSSQKKGRVRGGIGGFELCNSWWQEQISRWRIELKKVSCCWRSMIALLSKSPVSATTMVSVLSCSSAEAISRQTRKISKREWSNHRRLTAVVSEGIGNAIWSRAPGYQPRFHDLPSCATRNATWEGDGECSAFLVIALVWLFLGWFNLNFPLSQVWL